MSGPSPSPSAPFPPLFDLVRELATVTGLYFVVFFLSFLITPFIVLMTLKRDSSKSVGKWDIYKNGTTVVYGGSNKISTAKNIAAVLHMQDRDLTRKFSNAKSVPDTL
jgi:hypothetical protein